MWVGGVWGRGCVVDWAIGLLGGFLVVWLGGWVSGGSLFSPSVNVSFLKFGL